MSTIAVLFQPVSMQGAFNSEQVAAILKPPLTVGQSLEGAIAISSSREQVEVQLSNTKIDVRELSGHLSQGQSKIPKTLREFLALLSNPQVVSYGLNFILEIPREEPSDRIGRALLRPELKQAVGTDLASNNVALVFSRPPKTWTLRLESRPNSKINVNLNTSERTTNLPGPDRLSEELGQQFEALRILISQLGL